jgi:riboflavin kinase / FMN adenylyltransferase
MQRGPMLVLRDLDSLRTLSGPIVLAAGMFDGVHCGHQAVINAAIARAAEIGGRACVLTFDPHPSQVLRPQAAPRLLCTRAHQLHLFTRQGLHTALLCTFDATFAAIPPEQFIIDLCAACPLLDSIYVGQTWRFGAQRRGDVSMLTAAGETHGFRVIGIEPLLHLGSPISSTRVREALTAGDLPLAQALLGRHASVMGRVLHGDERGRTLGFPTANIEVSSVLLPPPGVYAMQVGIDGVWRPAVGNLGTRPTIDAQAQRLSLEVHVLDFSGDLYDRELEVRFVKHLRGEQRFDGLEALKTQIARDVAAARAVSI